MVGGCARDQKRGENGVDVEVACCEKPTGTREGRGAGEKTEDSSDRGIFGGSIGFQQRGELSHGVNICLTRRS